VLGENEHRLNWQVNNPRCYPEPWRERSKRSSRKDEDHVALTTLSPDALPSALNTFSDDDLVAQVVCGCEDALGAIYTRYHRLVYVIALRLTGDHMVAEEVMQDVFHIVWQSAGAFRPGGSLAAWLIGIARHRAIDATRSRTFRSRAREEILDDLRLGDVSEGAANYAETIVRYEMLASALAHLTPKQRQGIDLAYFSGLTHVEIAAHLHKPVGTVKSRIHLALERLRLLLVGMEDEMAY
jgi:RNA polymerase sigma-70 factor (ECF subfamily)